MQIKTTRRYYFTPIRMATVNKQTNKQKTTSVDKDVEKLDPLYTLGGNVKW